MITDIFPPLAFCFGFIVTRFLSSRPQSNDGAAGSRLGNKDTDIELGDAQKPPQSTEEVFISYSNEEEDRELRMMAAMGRIPKEQRRKKRSNRSHQGLHPMTTMRWHV